MELVGNINSSVLVIGVFHGDEPQGKRLIDSYLCENSASKLLFIPCLNEYGYDNNIRTNENGVDINRNFPTKNWILSEQNEFYGGSEPASEIQTRFVIDTIEQYKPKYILTLHSPYKIVNYDGEGAELAEKISKIINYPVQPSIGYPTPGSFGTWAGVERGIPTITLELDEKESFEKLKEPVFRIFKMLENL